MRVLVACEFSGRVRDAFLARGHDATSCDLLATESPGPHIRGPVDADVLGRGWDLIVGFPPCTHLASSGARWFKSKATRPQQGTLFADDVPARQEDALALVMLIAGAPCERIAIENPVGRLSTLWRELDQIVDPWWFGDPYRKRTCLWLKGLAPLRADPGAQPPTGDVVTYKGGEWRMAAWMNLPPGPGRGHARSLTFPGFSRAMAEQWGG